MQWKIEQCINDMKKSQDKDWTTADENNGRKKTISKLNLNFKMTLNQHIVVKQNKLINNHLKLYTQIRVDNSKW